MNEKTLRQQFEDAKWEGRNPLVIVTGQLMGERQGGSSFQDLDTAGMFYWNLLLDGRNPTIAIELPPPVDRSNVCTTDGRPAEEVRAEQQNDPEGMHKSYLVLCADERAKGFVRPLRDEYRHEKCGTVTTMGNALAQTYARDPGFYGRTFCVHCGGHFPVGEDGEFVWLDGSKVGT